MVFKNAICDLYSVLCESFEHDIFVSYDTILQIIEIMMQKDEETASKLVNETSLMRDVLLQASENTDYAIKLCCTSLLIELYIIGPDFIVLNEPGLGNMTVKESILAVILQGASE